MSNMIVQDDFLTVIRNSDLAKCARLRCRPRAKWWRARMLAIPLECVLLAWLSLYNYIMTGFCRVLGASQNRVIVVFE